MKKKKKKKRGWWRRKKRKAMFLKRGRPQKGKVDIPQRECSQEKKTIAGDLDREEEETVLRKKKNSGRKPSKGRGCLLQGGADKENRHEKGVHGKKKKVKGETRF